MFEKYIKLQKGNLPLIISVPHGGYKDYKELPKRKNGILGTDKATIKLANELIIGINSEIQNKKLYY